LRFLLSRDHGGSDDGGRDEFVEFCRPNASNSASRASNSQIRWCWRAMISFASSRVRATGGGGVVTAASVARFDRTSSFLHDYPPTG
jgi:hypothetical protein